MRTATLLAILLFTSISGRAQDLEIAATDPDKAFLAARELAAEKKYDEARVLLGAILVHYPQYTDVRNLLAKTFSWDGQYDRARGYFDQLLSHEARNQEIWIAAINNEIFARDSKRALHRVDRGLEFLPGDPELMALKKSLEEGSLTQNKALLARNETLGLSMPENRTFKNNLGAFSEVRVFDQVFDSQYALGIEYIRQEEFGRIIPRLTFANRFGQEGIQYEIDAYPRIDKKSYAYLNYGYSGAAIFPRHRAGAEFYRMVSQSMEVSAGMRYLDFRESTATTYTGSIGLYKGNYFMAFRPSITPRSNNPTAYFGTILLRRYGKTADVWFGARLNAGVEPESQQVFLGNTLLSESTRYVEIQELLLEYQFTGKGLASLYRASLGARRQEFLNEPGTYFWAMAVGIRYLSRF